MIKIDIMKNDSKVVDVDPGTIKGALNQVNELHEYQSYVIQCDQKDNRTLILNSIKNYNGTDVTVKQAESKDESEGTYYYISVVPQVNKPDLVEKLRKLFGIQWMHFVLKYHYLKK